jgi:CubicO group peptidase (beta-lactamase class C family)
MQNDSIFRIASMTKAVTSVGVMILYKRGHFLLNDPVARCDLEFAEPRVAVSFDDDGNVIETRPASRELTIADLLSHSSGISYGFLDSTLRRSHERAGGIDGCTTTNLTPGEGRAVLDCL